MVVEQIRKIDTSGDNKINEAELREAMKPNGFLSKEENLTKVGNLLSGGEVGGQDLELLNSLMKSFDTLQSQIFGKERINEEDKNILTSLKKILGLRPDCSDEIKNIDKFLADQEELKRQDEIDGKIVDSYSKLDSKSKGVLDKLLGEGEGVLIEKIDNYLSREIDINVLLNKLTDKKAEKIIGEELEGINILNKLTIQNDPERHEKIKEKVNEVTINMMHEINKIIAENKNYEDPTLNYTKSQVKMIQLWANVCYGADLQIDGDRGKYAHYLKKNNESQTETSVYIYRLEIQTRKDVIDNRHDNINTRTDNLLYIPDLDEIFDGLSIEDQNEILKDFLGDCFLTIRAGGMYFENKIGNDNLKELIELAVQVKRYKNMSVEDGIKYREQIIATYRELGQEENNKTLIQRFQEEISILSTKNPTTGEYMFKTMGDYYSQQLSDLKNTIKLQHKENVDIEYRQYAQNEFMAVVKEYSELGETLDKEKLIHIVDRLANLYNTSYTQQYRKWMESGEIFDQSIIRNIAVKFNKHLNNDEKKRWGNDFLQFMKKSGDVEAIARDFNKYSSTIDLVSQIEELENGSIYYLSQNPILDTGNLGYGSVAFDIPLTKPGQGVSAPIDQYLNRNNSRYEGAHLYNNPYGNPYDNPYLSESNPHCYLKLGGVCFKGGPWIKDIARKIAYGEIKVVITKPSTANRWVENEYGRDYMRGLDGKPIRGEWKPGSPGELCKYEKQPNGDIWLWKFDENGNLPNKPTSIITGKEQTQAGLAISSAFESIDTTEFNDVMQEFSEKKGSFMEIQEDIEKFMIKYQNKELSNSDEKNLKKDIATMFRKISKIDVTNLRKLKDILSKMKGNENGITNPYEKSILDRIDQIETLITVCTDKEYRNGLCQLENLESNDEWHENINWATVVAVLGSIASFIVGIVCAIPSGGTSLVGSVALTTFLRGLAATSAITALTYFGQQEIKTHRNFKCAETKIETDRYGNKVEIPGYLDEKDKTTFYKYRTGEISFGDHLGNIVNELGPELAQNAILSVLGHWSGSGLKSLGTANYLGDATDLLLSNTQGLLQSFVGTAIATKIIWNKIAKPGNTEAQVVDIIGQYFNTLIPQSLEGDSQTIQDISGNLSCSVIDENGNMTIEYNPDDPNFQDVLLKGYRNDKLDVQDNENGVYVVTSKSGNKITLKPSRAPSQYRQLPSQIKSDLSNIGGVDVDPNTGEISYKDPESLKKLGVYVDAKGMGLLSQVGNSSTWSLRLNHPINTRIMIKPQVI